ncbi:MAG: serine hydrolase domain-containing protein [Caldilineaceae bacterium]
MKTFSRRKFLASSAWLSVGLSLTACQPIRRPNEMTIPSATTDSNPRFAGFVEDAQKGMATHQSPGMAAGIVQGGKLIYTNSFGVRNLKTGAPMTPQSVMTLGSISKSFTAAAIMQLVETGKVDIDQPYVSYVPYFAMEDARYKAITIRHLLAHNSGLPELTSADTYGEFSDPQYDDGAAERFVRSLKTGILLNQDPGGDQFRYSDVGYDILADLIHKVSGELFEDYIRHHIFDPLGMASSTFLHKEVPTDQLVAAHVYNESGKPIVWDSFPYNRIHAPSSGLHSNVEDMSRWVLAQMSGGELDGKRILQPQSQAHLWDTLFTLDMSNEVHGWGWGCGVGDLEGKQFITGIGDKPGSHTVVSLLPTEGLAAILLDNVATSMGSYEEPYYTYTLSVETLEKLLHDEL